MSIKKSKPISKETYIETFCQERRIRERRVIYVSEKTHERIRKIALMYNDSYVTVTSLAEAIFNEHFNLYEEFLNQEYRDFINAGVIREDFNKPEDE